MRASNLLLAMPATITVSDKGTDVVLYRHGDADIMQDGTLIRHWVDESASVGLVLFSKDDQEGYAPSRTMMMGAIGGPIPESVARAVAQAFMPDTVVMAIEIGPGQWLMRSDQMLHNMGHRVATQH